MDIQILSPLQVTFYYVHIPVGDVIENARLLLFDPRQHREIDLYQIIQDFNTANGRDPHQSEFNTSLSDELIDLRQEGMNVEISYWKNDRAGTIIVRTRGASKTVMSLEGMKALGSSGGFASKSVVYYTPRADISFNEGDISLVNIEEEEVLQDMIIATAKAGIVLKRMKVWDPEVVQETIRRHLVLFSGIASPVKAERNGNVVVQVTASKSFRTNLTDWMSNTDSPVIHITEG